MALTFDAKARIPATALATTTSAATANFTCGANAKVLVVMVLYAGVTARTGGAPTYNSVALTQVESRQGVTETSVEMWYMLAPPVGQALSVSVPNGNGVTMWVYVASGNAAAGYSCELDSSGVNATTAANPSVSVTTIAANTLMFAVVATGDNTFAPTARTGTSLYEEDIAIYGGAGQYYNNSGTGATALSWTDATSDDYGAIGAAFKEVTAPVIVSLATAAASIAGQALTVTPGAMSVAENAAALTLAGLQASISAPPPATSIQLNAAAIAVAGQPASVDAGTRYWVGGPGNWSDAANHWAAVSGGTPNAVYLPDRYHDVFIDSNSGFGSGGTITFTTDGYCKNFTANSGHTYSIANNGTVKSLDVYGSLTLESGITWSVLWIDFYSTSAGNTIDTSGVTLTGTTVYFDGVGGEWTLQSNLTTTSNFSIYAGTFDANIYNVTGVEFTISSSSGHPITINMGSGTWEVNANFSVIENGGQAITINAETSLLKFINDNSFHSCGKTYYNVQALTGLDFYNATANPLTIHDLTLTADPLDSPYFFASGKTVVITGDFIAVGTAAHLIYIQEDNVSQFTLSKASGIVNCDYVDISNSIATGGATWNAGGNSVNSTPLTNEGWIFESSVSLAIAALTIVGQAVTVSAPVGGIVVELQPG